MKLVLISVLMFVALQSVMAAQAMDFRAPATVFKDCADCPEMVVIPAGRFMMGVAPGEEEREALSDQFRNRSQPQHWVDVKRFSVGKFEVTRRQYRAFAEATGRSSDGCFVWSHCYSGLRPRFPCCQDRLTQ